MFRLPLSHSRVVKTASTESVQPYR